MLKFKDSQMIRAARLELLIAENFQENKYFSYKVSAYVRATGFFTGNPYEEITDFDAYSVFSRIKTEFCLLVLDSYSDDSVIVKIASLNGLCLLITELGCSLSTDFEKIVMLLAHIESINHEIIESRNKAFSAVIVALQSGSPRLLSGIYNNVVKNIIGESSDPLVTSYLLQIASEFFQSSRSDLNFDDKVITSALTALVNENSQIALNLWVKMINEIVPNFTYKPFGEFVKWCCTSLNEKNHEKSIWVLQGIYSILSDFELETIELEELSNIVKIIFFEAMREEGMQDLARVSWKCLELISENLGENVEEILAKIEKILKSRSLNSDQLNFSLFFIESVTKYYKGNFQRLVIAFIKSLPGNTSDSIFQIIECLLQRSPSFNYSSISALISNISDPLTIHSACFYSLKQNLIKLLHTSPHFPLYLSTFLSGNPTKNLESLSFFIDLITEIQGENAIVLMKSWKALANLCITLLIESKWEFKLRGMEILRLMIEILTDLEYTKSDLMCCIANMIKTLLDEEIDSRVLFLSLRLAYDIFTRVFNCQCQNIDLRTEITLILWNSIEKNVTSVYINIHKLSLEVLLACISTDYECFQVNSLLFPFVFSLLNAKRFYLKRAGLRIISVYCGIHEFSNGISQIRCAEIPIHIWKQVISMSFDHNKGIKEPAEMLVAAGLENNDFAMRDVELQRKKSIFDREKGRLSHRFEEILLLFQEDVPEKLENNEVKQCNFETFDNEDSENIEQNKEVKVFQQKVLKKQLPSIKNEYRPYKPQEFFRCDKELPEIPENSTQNTSVIPVSDHEKLLKLPLKLPRKRLEQEISNLLKNLASPFRQSSPRQINPPSSFNLPTNSSQNYFRITVNNQ